MLFYGTTAVHLNMKLRRRLTATYVDVQDIDPFWMPLKLSALRNHVECLKQMVVADAAWKMEMVLPVDAVRAMGTASTSRNPSNDSRLLVLSNINQTRN